MRAPAGNWRPTYCSDNGTGAVRQGGRPAPFLKVNPILPCALLFIPPADRCPSSRHLGQSPLLAPRQSNPAARKKARASREHLGASNGGGRIPRKTQAEKRGIFASVLGSGRRVHARPAGKSRPTYCSDNGTGAVWQGGGSAHFLKVNLILPCALIFIPLAGKCPSSRHLGQPPFLPASNVPAQCPDGKGVSPSQQ